MIVEPAAVELEQQFDDRRRRRRVEVAGRLVGEHERRFTDDRTRDRNPLPFAARHLRWSVMQAMAEPDLLQCLDRALPALAPRAAAIHETRRPRCRPRRPLPADGTAGTRSRGAPPAGPPARRPTSTSRPGPRRASCPTTAGRACRSRSATSTCRNPTARRPPPTHRRQRAATRPPARAPAATPRYVFTTSTSSSTGDSGRSVPGYHRSRCLAPLCRCALAVRHRPCPRPDASHCATSTESPTATRRATSALPSRISPTSTPTR